MNAHSVIGAPQQPLRIMVVDDHPIVREGIVGALESMAGVVVVAQAGDGEQALELAASTSPNLVLMDLQMPRMDGVQATRLLRQAYPQLVVVVLTTYESDGDILAAIEAGATGYLLKAAPRAELLAGIKAAAEGQVALSPAAARVLVARQSAPAPVRLSARETEVLALVATGASNAQIGQQLFIAEATVKTHLQRIFEKLGVSDRTRAVTLAMERGLLPR